MIEYILLISLLILGTIFNFVIAFILLKLTKNKKLKDKNKNFGEINYENDTKELNALIDEVFTFFMEFVVTPYLLSNKGIINDEFSDKIILEISLKILDLLSDDYKEFLSKYFSDIEKYIIFSIKRRFNVYAIKHNLNTLKGKEEL